jgi:hypothetical protein
LEYFSKSDGGKPVMLATIDASDESSGVALATP